MRVLLLQPRPKGGLGFQSTICVEPLGLEIVAGALIKAHHQVKLLDLLGGELPANTVEEFNPQAIGISCSFAVDTYRVLDLAQALRRINPEFFIFVGGHHASLTPEAFFHPAIDALVIGEGEATAPELICALEGARDLSQVRGLVLNHPEGQIFTGARPLVDLDQIPFPCRKFTTPYRSHYYLGFRRPIITVETSRGCPYRCNFCSVWRFNRGKFRAITPERIVEELAQLPPGEVLFTDDNFLADVPRVLRIAALVKQRKMPRRRFIIQARSDTIVAHPELIAELKEIGLDQVFIGFEKIENQDLENVGKRNTIENNERALKILQSFNIGVYASFIVDPQFNETDFKKLAEYVKRLRISQPYFSVLTPLPGTELFEQVKECITTFNYELYDLLHAVLPTKLPLPRFYQELVSLYRSAYLKPSNALFTVWWALKQLLLGKISLDHWRRLWHGARLTVNPEAYFKL